MMLVLLCVQDSIDVFPPGNYFVWPTEKSRQCTKNQGSGVWAITRLFCPLGSILNCTSYNANLFCTVCPLGIPSTGAQMHILWCKILCWGSSNVSYRLGSFTYGYFHHLVPLALIWIVVAILVQQKTSVSLFSPKPCIEISFWCMCHNDVLSQLIQVRKKRLLETICWNWPVKTQTS